MMGAASASDTADAVPKTIIDTVIDTQGMTRRFGAFTAVDNLNLHIRRGEIFGFLGPNGCGKSTTIRMLTGLLSPSEGSVQVLGQSLPQGGERVRTCIGYMTQKFSLYDDLTVAENLHFIGEVYGLRGAVRKARVAELCCQYELEALQRRLAGSLSGGQKQRLALAAAVIHQPELLFLDEPTAAVDPQNRREFWEQLFDLSAAGTTILVATHYMDEAERCHRIGIMQDGRMRLTGAPAQLMSEMGGAVFEVDGAHLRQLKQHLLGITSVISAAQLGARLRVLVSYAEAEPLTFLQQQVRQFDTQMDAQHHAEIDANSMRTDSDARTIQPVRPSLEDVFVLATGPQAMSLAGAHEAIILDTPSDNTKRDRGDNSDV